MNLKTIQAIVDELAPDGDWSKVIIAYAPSYEKYKNVAGYEGYFAAPKVQLTSNNGNLTLSVHHAVLGYLVGCSLKPVESCCGMTFLYAFRTGQPKLVPDEWFKKVMDAFFLNALDWSFFSSRRVIVNMVESGRSIYDPQKVVGPRDDGRDAIIAYPQFYNYFHKNAAKVNTMLMPNKNTGNVIHHMEVLFDNDYFKVS